MKRPLPFALATLAAAATHGVRADDMMTFSPPPFIPSLSRAEVTAQLAQFRRAGVDPWADHYDQLAGLHSDRSRDEIMSEYVAGRAVVAAFTGENSGSVHLAQQALAPAPAGTHHAATQH